MPSSYVNCACRDLSGAPMMNGAAEEAIRDWIRQLKLGKVRFHHPKESPVAPVMLVMRQPETNRCLVVDIGPSDSPIIADGPCWAEVARQLQTMGVYLR
jgi:hypothetical protein